MNRRIRQIIFTVSLTIACLVFPAAAELIGGVPTVFPAVTAPTFTATSALGFIAPNSTDPVYDRGFGWAGGPIFAAAPLDDPTIVYLRHYPPGVNPPRLRASGTGPVYADFGSTIAVYGAGVTSAELLAFNASNFVGFYLSSQNSSGTPGAATINHGSGRSAIVAGQSSVVITNGMVNADSAVFASLRTLDATATGIRATIPAAGSFTVHLNAAATAAVVIDWFVIQRGFAP